MKDLLWKMFKETGELKYYLFMKEIEEDEDRESKRNSFK